MKTLIILLLFSTNVKAVDSNFENIWKKISENSFAMKASNEQVKATLESKNRSQLHWLPNIYAGGSIYKTNDPGANMFGLLSQRAITQNDFAPDLLNHPSSNTYSKGTIGANWYLYEGGMKASFSKVNAYQAESKKYESAASNLQIYAEVAKNYFNLITLSNQRDELLKLKNIIDSIISRYQIGNKNNPLGYSGLLGLKSLNNKLQALLLENDTKYRAYKNGIQELSGDSNIEVTKNLKVENLLDEYLSNKNSEYSTTYRAESLKFNAFSASEVVGIENSRNLPRVGLFLENNFFNGDRKSANSYAGGIFLNWNLFSSSDIGTKSEAIHNSYSAEYYYKAISQKEKIEFDSYVSMEKTLKSTLQTLDESRRLLEEQTAIANNLFKNGLINALQLVEVLSRRVDLVNSTSETELTLIDTSAKMVNLSSNNQKLLSEKE